MINPWNIKPTIYIRKAYGIGWLMGADEFTGERFFMTKRGALLAARKWQKRAKQDQLPKPKIYLDGTND